eukprot:CAMPEP_0177660372 /NCGR_PEP_ID=MMETSP0447-20121125/18002_1 /TAXON_ID=0 /ORGANISM="Stygamoeba regulata, Strain BSH-02190019" /LENGTH=283 /DNA_ID=CAMNT_0019165427 /DNA_START=202 /DNA_END=1053 /DNA_ORIENTATION=-
MKSASSLVLCRRVEGTAGDPCDFAVLMVKRAAKSRFFPNAFVFPGGVSETPDASVPAHYHSPTVSAPAVDWPASAAVCAVRETFEETGVLCAAPCPAAAARLPVQQLAQWRARVQANAAEFGALCVAAGVCVPLPRLLPWAHWVTPEQEKWRYDTHFFLAAHEEWAAQPVLHDENETVEVGWVSPAQALARFRARTLHLAPPTWHLLRELERLQRLDSVLDAAPTRDLRPNQPEIVKAADGVHIVLNDDAHHPRCKGTGTNRIILKDPFSYEHVVCSTRPSAL